MDIKKKVFTALMLLGSGFFIYQGFTMLFHPAEETPLEKIELKEVSHP